MPPQPTDVELLGGRYDNLVMVFGKDFVEKLGNLKYFIKLWCTWLRVPQELCQMGSAVVLRATWRDRRRPRRLSNLARQFLFREDTVSTSRFGLRQGVSGLSRPGLTAVTLSSSSTSPSLRYSHSLPNPRASSPGDETNPTFKPEALEMLWVRRLKTT